MGASNKVTCLSLWAWFEKKNPSYLNTMNSSKRSIILVICE